MRLQVVADQAGSKHTGDSRNRGKGGQPVWPITTPDRRGRGAAHLWRTGGPRQRVDARLAFVPARAAGVAAGLVGLKKRSSPGSAPASWILRTTTDSGLISGRATQCRDAGVDGLGVPGCCGCAAQNGSDLRAVESGCRARNCGKSLPFVAMLGTRRALGRARVRWWAAISRGRRMRVAASEKPARGSAVRGGVPRSLAGVKSDEVV